MDNNSWITIPDKLSKRKLRIANKATFTFIDVLNRGTYFKTLKRVIIEFLFERGYKETELLDSLLYLKEQYEIKKKQPHHLSLLGYCYEYGIGTRIDREYAVKIYLQGDENGD
ncbi:3267_t:CDS:1, partial [Ambispora gerdemannii]